ncbi:MAG: hypothetical protein WDN09_03285 [bacterium]
MAGHIAKHFNKDALHHAYLIEASGARAMPEILEFLESIGVAVVGNPDVTSIAVDSFKIEDARSLNASATLKGFGGKKVFIVTANSFLSEAQNAMLKVFEEPIADTHFFVITASIQGLLPTFVSRFFVIREERGEGDEAAALAFLKAPYAKRVDFLKELLAEGDEDEDDRAAESARSKALRFLNALEALLHKKYPLREGSEAGFFDQMFAVREFLRQPGSSAKMLMESVALAVPLNIPLAVPNL